MTQRIDQVPSDWVAITPSDTAGVNYSAIYVGGAGNVTVKGRGGVAATFTAPPVGTTLSGNFSAVMLTGTTATLLLGAVP